MHSIQQDTPFIGGFEYPAQMSSIGRFENSDYPDPLLQDSNAAGQSWNPMLKAYPVEGSSVTCLEYDPVQELLWTGSNNGRVQSYLSGSDFDSQEMEPMRYSSFRSSDSAIVNLWPLERSVICVSKSNCRLYSKGGIMLSEIATSTTMQDTEVSFTCSSMFRKVPATLSSFEIENQQFWQLPSNLFLGTNSDQSFCFDLNRSTDKNLPKLVFNTSCSSTCVRENGSFVIFGCSDGKLRLFDGRLRSDKPQYTLDAQTASILDMTVNVNGFTVATCGLEAKALNPYDPNSPKKIRPDQNVHVIDLRMMKSLSLVPLTVGSNPVAIRFPSSHLHSSSPYFSIT
jgi:hypothetical protein